MKEITIILTILILNACSTPNVKRNQVSLEDAQWEPINQNYINKKDF